MSSDLADQIAKQQEEDRNAIALLLHKHLSQENHLLVQSNPMGNTEAYISSVTLEWLDSRVRYASQLPLFRQKFDPDTKNVIRDAETIHDLQQRPLDWSRQAPLAQYLAAREAHKFPAVLVVISPEWVNDPYAEEWGLDGRAIKSATDFTPFDAKGTVGLLGVSPGMSIFALDGQHRLMGVQGLMELIKTGKLQCYNKQKNPTGSIITANDLANEYGVNSAALQSLAYEKIGIEFIPAVIEGETHEDARRRVRSIFVHVNLMALKLSRGQLALLDEDNGFAIVARKTAVTHPLLAPKKERNPRVNWDSATVASKSTVLTTLQALQDMAEGYLGYKFPHWKSSDKKNLIPMRPNDEELEEGLASFQELLTYLTMLPSYERLEVEDTPKIRRFSHEKGGGEANMLFRPVGQIALAQALGYLVYRRGFSIKTIFKKLRKFDEKGGFSGIEYSESLFYGVLYDPIRKRVQVSGRDLATRLIVYVLGGMKDNLEVAELRQKFADARTIEDKTISFEGRFVKPREVKLPEVL